MTASLTRRSSMAAFAGAGILAVSPSAAGQTRMGALKRDRQSVLAMAGDFRVRFNFRETAAFVAD